MRQDDLRGRRCALDKHGSARWVPPLTGSLFNEEYMCAGQGWRESKRVQCMQDLLTSEHKNIQETWTNLLSGDPDAPQPGGKLVSLVLLRHAAAVGQEADWVERPLACATYYESGRTLETQNV